VFVFAERGLNLPKFPPKH